MYTLTSRDAITSASEHWTVRGTLTEYGIVEDMLASPAWPRSHGDLLRVTGPQHDDLYVFDRATDTYLAAPAPFTLAFWEGDDADAAAMLRRCERVDRRRLVLAVCACARTVLDGVPKWEDRPRVAVETAERWARGEATSDEVQRAREDAWNVAVVAAVASSSASSVASSAAVASDSAFSAAAASVASVAATRALAPLVRLHIPLSVALCAALGLSDPLPLRFDAEVAA